jgi:hypothetical protein
MCDGTKTADKLAELNEISLFSHERAEQRFCPQTVPGYDGQYIVLVNGASDSSFTIDSVSMSSVIFPRETSQSEGMVNYRTMMTDGEMTVKENFGVNFFNIIASGLKAFGTDPNGACYMLKTIFVGHTHNGTVDYITNIRPQLFMIYDINANIDVTGAEYTISMVGVTNGATRMQHFSSVMDGFTFKIPKNSNLLTTFNKLEKDVNNYYDSQYSEAEDYYNCVMTGEETGNNLKFSERFTKVKYTFNLDKEYQTKLAGTSDIMKNQETGEHDPVITSPNEAPSIESVIDRIMRSSKELIESDLTSEESDIINNRNQNPSLTKDQLQKLQKSTKDRAVKRMYKITSTVETSPNEYTVRYDIHRAETALKTKDQLKTFVPTGPTGQQAGLEFDYIFTGRNIDILDMDIKMQMGLAFFQTLLVSPSYPTSATGLLQDYNKYATISDGLGTPEGPGDQLEESKTTCLTPPKDRKVKPPFFLGTKVKDPRLRGVKNPAQATSYESMLARHAAYENIETKLVIRGNPQLLEDTNITNERSLANGFQPFNKPKDVNSVIVGAEDTTDHDERVLCPDIHKIPAYVKVNIMMPSSYPGVEDPTNEGDFASPFWYQNWYYMIMIDHKFEGGEFTQELLLHSIPVDTNENVNTDKDKLTACAAASYTSVKRDNCKKNIQKKIDEVKNKQQQQELKDNIQTQQNNAGNKSEEQTRIDELTNKLNQCVEKYKPSA